MDLYKSLSHAQKVQWVQSLLHSILDSIRLFVSSVLDFKSASTELMFVDGFNVG